MTHEVERGACNHQLVVCGGAGKEEFEVALVVGGVAVVVPPQGEGGDALAHVGCKQQVLHQGGFVEGDAGGLEPQLVVVADGVAVDAHVVQGDVVVGQEVGAEDQLEVFGVIVAGVERGAFGDGHFGHQELEGLLGVVP